MEPFRLTPWDTLDPALSGQFYTCARPGRSIGSNKPVPDDLADAWAKGLPGAEGTVIVSMLGTKPLPDGKSEFWFYSFRSSKDDAGTPDQPTFQEWLDERHAERHFEVIEYPTVDLQPIDDSTMQAIAGTVSDYLKAGRTIVLVDSGGVGRTGRVCKYLGFRELR